MALDPDGKAALALHRFGLGPRPHTIRAIASDPQAALLAELERPRAGQVTDVSSLFSSDAAARQYLKDRVARKNALRARAMAASREMEKGSSAQSPEPKIERSVVGIAFGEEIKTRDRLALEAETGIVEKLVWFWSNHFCISTAKPIVRAMAGAYEREAIRPHVLGRFADLLLAVESHPAMLLYLDNARSIGPNSPVGRARKLGLNENLAREILELHTLGVRTGYTQEDVTTFAKVLTGWTNVPLRDQERGGQFEFRAQWHEPGPQIIMGKRYAEEGIAQGRAVLHDIARHPATAKHIATQLATYFVADAPPSALVDALAKRFLDTGGDLKEVTRTLLRADEAWAAPRNKLKRPSEWCLSALRAAGAKPSQTGIVRSAQRMLGEPLWNPPSPKGFSDQSAAWVDGVAGRLDIANRMGRYFEPAGNPSLVLDYVLGSLASAETRQTIAQAADGKQALALLLMAPEFLQR
jgi:uncharacterized protein (DUF1800 family)